MTDPQSLPPLTVGRVIALQLEDLQKRLQALEAAALILTTPIAPGAPPFLQAVLAALEANTKAIAKQERSLAALHEAMIEPGVVRALQRAVREP